MKTNLIIKYYFKRQFNLGTGHTRTFSDLASTDNTQGPKLYDKFMEILEKSIEESSNASCNEIHKSVSSSTNADTSSSLSSPPIAAEFIFRAYDRHILRAFTNFALCSARLILLGQQSVYADNGQVGGLSGGATPLPISIQKWSVLASPFVHKTAWTQLERRIYGRKVEVKTWDSLKTFDPLNGACTSDKPLFHGSTIMEKLLWYLEKHAPPDLWIEAKLNAYLTPKDAHRLFDQVNTTNLFESEDQ